MSEKTGMRYIRIPAPVDLLNQRVNRVLQEVETIGTKSYSYFDLVDEYVWTRKEWRKDELHANAFNRLVDLHDEAQKKGRKWIAMSEADYGIFAPFATLRDQDIGGPNLKKLVRLSQCVTFALSKEPEDIDALLETPEANVVREVSKDNN